MMLTRRQFLKAAASLPFWHVWLDAAVTVADDTAANLCARPWGFDGVGLTFPAYFVAGRRLGKECPHRLYLPLIQGS